MGLPMTFELIHYRRTDLSALRIHVDCAELDRCYELESDDGEEWRVVAWWGGDCERRTSPVSLYESNEVTRWAECSPQVDALWTAHVEREQFSAVCEW